MWNIPTHKPVPDSDYFAALPASGLILARAQTVSYLGQAEDDSALPTEDAVSDLSLIRSELVTRMQQEVKS